MIESETILINPTAPNWEARERGYRHAVLFSTEMGVPVYKRLGFRLTEARINRYLWRGE